MKKQQYIIVNQSDFRNLSSGSQRMTAEQKKDWQKRIKKIVDNYDYQSV